MIPPYQQRVIAEKDALDAKLVALIEFLLFPPPGAVLKRAERRRLQRQREVMREYSSILAERIAAFPQ